MASRQCHTVTVEEGDCLFLASTRRPPLRGNPSLVPRVVRQTGRSTSVLREKPPPLESPNHNVSWVKLFGISSHIESSLPRVNHQTTIVHKSSD